MFARPDGAAGYEEDGKPKRSLLLVGLDESHATGDQFNRWHTGSLDGTATIVIRRSDGTTWWAIKHSHQSHFLAFGTRPR